jgi:hypothetical protein
MLPNQEWLQKRFDEFNQRYFGNKLSGIKLKINPNLKFNGADCFGLFTFDARVNRKGVVTKLIPGSLLLQINGNQLLEDRDEKDWLNTLMHEMIHAYVYTVCMECDDNNPHGGRWAELANYFNSKFGFNISAVGNEKLTGLDIQHIKQKEQSQNQEEVVDYNNVFLLFTKYDNQLNTPSIMLICENEQEFRKYEQIVARKRINNAMIGYKINNEQVAEIVIKYKKDHLPPSYDGETYAFSSGKVLLKQTFDDFFNELSKFANIKLKKRISEREFTESLNRL